MPAFLAISTECSVRVRPLNVRWTLACAVAGLIGVFSAVGTVHGNGTHTNTGTGTVNTLGEVENLIAQGRPREALQRLDAGSAQRGTSSRFLRGIALTQLGRADDAVKVYRQLIDDHPGMTAAYNNLAVLLNAQGHHEQARDVLEQGLRASAEHAALYRNLGNLQIYLARERYRKAFPVLEGTTPSAPRLAMLRQPGPTGDGRAPVPQPSDWRVATAALDVSPWRTPVRPVMVATTQATTPATTAAIAAAISSAATPSATPAPSVAPAPSTKAQDEVRAALQAWAGAWSRRDIDGYLAAYADDFQGQSASRADWARERRERILGRREIRIALSDIAIEMRGDRAIARLRQDYRSEILQTVSRKTLALRRAPSGDWKIDQETSGSSR